jgi:CRISPR-associated protein Cas6
MWQDEEDNSEQYSVPDTVQDVLFSIECKTLPVDHAQALSTALLHALPWLADEAQAGIHLIHVAGSGNGWERPEGGQAILHLSRRTKLVLRIPKHRLQDVQQLSGQVLDVAGNRMVIGKSSNRLLSVTNTLYARYVAVSDPQMTEKAFIEEVVAELKSAGLHFKKVLCGKDIVFETDSGPLLTRSLMVADLLLDDAIRLQEIGIGKDIHKKLGCGLFIAHKSV